MIHCFHGLFGDPDIWTGLFPDSEFIAYDLYNNFDPKQVSINPIDTIIGYSLGGRIALNIASENYFNFKKLILISSHPGLNDEEKVQRRNWENSIINKFETLTKVDFLRYWESLPLFSKSSLSLEISDEKYQKSFQLFKQYLLSNQINYRADLIKYRHKIVYLFGQYDSKYSKIADELNLIGIRTMQFNSDHRVYACKEELKAFLYKEVLL
jgi:2-succinyl-6-hydroxy-2,4-cyclohexadiene-1-carboxylate synthase